MDIRFNARGNGACPLCRRKDACRVRAALQSGVKDLQAPGDSSLEVVVYECPWFSESS